LTTHTVVARGIDRRAPRMIAPRFWTGLSVLRGMIAPGFDLVSSRHPRLQSLLREADVERRSATLR